MKYTRLFADESDQSDFDDVEVEFVSTDYVAGADPLQLSPEMDAEAYRLMKAPAGWSSDWHPSSARNLFVVLSGIWEVTASSNETKRFKPSDVLLVEDTSGKGHKSAVVSEDDSLALMVQLA